MQKAMILFGAMLLASCATVPKSVSEFRDAMSNHPAFMKEEAHDIDLEIAVVVKNVESKIKECFQAGPAVVTRPALAVIDNSVVYHTQIRMAGEDKAEMFIQEESIHQSAGLPEDGSYIFLADFKQIAPSQTRLTMYGPSISTWKPIFEAIKGWGVRQNTQCPNLP
jgi:hypothetical protein